jgi:formylglycine-generating enzyme required for sulfatase activity
MSAALRRLYGSLNEQSRQYEALGMEKDYPEVGSARVRKSGEAAALIQKMEKNLLPIPGTDVFMGKYEVSVGEWKQYLDAEGLPPWEQPWLNACRDLKRNPKEAHMIVGNPSMGAGPFEQEDTHPVVYLSLEQVNQFCDWLCLKTGKKWRLPRESEWLAAIGGKKNPWGDNFPPGATDGNYAMAEDGSFDPSVRGVDGFLGTAPVGSFRANLYGFHDLAGNAWEPVSLTGRAEKKWTMMGGGWAAGVPSDQSDGFRSARRIERDARGLDYGLRLVRE